MLFFQHVTSARKSLCKSSPVDKGTLVPLLLLLSMFCTRVKYSLPRKSQIVQVSFKTKVLSIEFYFSMTSTTSLLDATKFPLIAQQGSELLRFDMTSTSV